MVFLCVRLSGQRWSRRLPRQTSHQTSFKKVTGMKYSTKVRGIVITLTVATCPYGQSRTCRAAVIGYGALLAGLL